MTAAKKPAVKKPTATKPVVKKPAAKQAAAATKAVAPKKVAVPKAAVEVINKINTEPPKVERGEGKLLYTIRLEPEYIAKLEAEGAKRGVKHAVIAREAIHAYFNSRAAQKAA